MHFTDLMRAADPAADVQPLSPEQRDHVLDTAMSSTDTPATARPHGRRVRRIAVGIAASLVIGGIGFQLVNHDGGEAVAAEVLRTAAIHASDPPVRPGQYWEITSTTTGINSVCPTEDNNDCYDLYVSRRSQVEYAEVTGDLPSWRVESPEEVVKVLSTREEILPPIPGAVYTMNLSPNDLAGAWQVPSMAWLGALPRDPVELQERLSADLGDRDDTDGGRSFVYIADLLRTGLVPADLRSALFEVLAANPEIRVAESDVMVEGVPAVAIRGPGTEVSVELVIDPQAGQVVAERNTGDVAPDPDYAAGTTYTRRLVDEVPADVQERAVHLTCEVWDEDPTTWRCDE